MIYSKSRKGVVYLVFASTLSQTQIRIVIYINTHTNVLFHKNKKKQYI